MLAILSLVLGVAFVFSMVGLGGAQVYTPTFYWMGMDVRTQAVPLALWLNFATQITAGVNYWRHGLVKFRAALPMIAGLIVFAPIGAMVSHRVPDSVILFLFATMTLAAAVQSLSGWKPRGGEYRRAKLAVIGLVVGGGTGFLGGMIGRGGGSLLVPILLLMGFDPKHAAATSAFAGGFSALAGFLGHLGATGLGVTWGWFAAFTAAAMLAAFGGSRTMAGHLDAGRVRRLFSILLLGIATKLYWDVFSR